MIHTSPNLILVVVIRSHDIWKSIAFIKIYVWKYFPSTGREESAQLCVYVGEEVGVCHHHHHQYYHHYNHNDMFDRRPRRVSSTAVPNIKRLQCNLSFHTQGLFFGMIRVSMIFLRIFVSCLQRFMALIFIISKDCGRSLGKQKSQIHCGYPDHRLFQVNKCVHAQSLIKHKYATNSFGFSTKSLTAIALAWLHDQGLLEYNAKISQYWPEVS